MKRLQKLAIVFTLMAAMTATMFGCNQSEQKKAFRAYSISLQDDSELWNAISEAANKTDTRDLTATKAVIQANIIPNLNKLQQNAAQRNSAIADPELQQVDAKYVSCINNLKEGYALILSGIDNKDTNTIQTAVVRINGALDDMKGYVTGMKSYMNKYGIKKDDSLDDVLNKLNSL